MLRLLGGDAGGFIEAFSARVEQRQRRPFAIRLARDDLNALPRRAVESVTICCERQALR